MLGDRVVVMRDNALFPIDFDFRIGTDDSVSANAVLLVGKHGGEGYYELDDDLLFISLGIHGGCPPRFASDCGDFFAFERDRTFDLPNVPPWPRDDLVSPHLGLLRWQDNDIEWLGAWIGQVMLTDGSECEIWASDYLIPLRRFLPTLEHVFLWLKQHLSEVKRICAERVMEWIDEDEEFCQLSEEEIATTISVDSISASNGEARLWASTTIPIDHSIRVWLDINAQQITATGASIEG